MMKRYCRLLFFVFSVFLISGKCIPQDSPEVTPEIIQGIKMVSIQAGSFMMGHVYRHDPAIPDNVDRYFPDEQPVHKVILNAFQIGATEITQGQYRAVTGSNPSTFAGDDNLPVTNVSASDALKFCNLLSAATGLEPCYNEKTGICDFSKNGFRLPTEAEWEYACRAGTTTLFNTGNNENDLERTGWYIGNSDGKSHPVAQKEPNDWGLYDMHGNVYEYCYDGYGKYNYGIHRGGQYSAESVSDPIGSENWRLGSMYDNFRIMRGGSWFSEPFSCRSFTRAKVWTGSQREVYGGGIHYNGFRIARSPG